jgi:hypothetical protein
LNRFGDQVRQAVEETRAFARGTPELLASNRLAAAAVSASG